MCNPTNNSLSHFLEGVNFMDEPNTMSDLQLENEFFGEDGNLLMLDMDMEMMEDDIDCVLDGSSLEFPKETLPPLEGVDDDICMMDSLLCPPTVTTTTTPSTPARAPAVVSAPPSPVPSPTTTPSIPAPSSLVHQSSMEKLAHCMRRSELSLKDFKQNTPQSHPVLMKANPFFTGSRVTITPELQHSRQQLWSFMRQQQQYMHKTPFTAAA